MRILQIINLPSSAINFIGGQFLYFREKGGHDMHLICSPGDGIEDFCKKNLVHYHSVKMNRQISFLDDIKALIEICRYIQKNKIDIVIAHQSKGRLLGMIAARICGVKFRITFAHGVVYETMSGIKRKLLIWNDRLVSAIANRVVCVSNYVIEQRRKDNIDKAGKCVLLGKGSCNGLDTIYKFNPDLVSTEDINAIRCKYGLMPDDFIIGFCGRLVRDKGVIELIEAYDLFKSKHPYRSVKLFVIGQPEKRDGLPKETLSRLNSDDSIIFTGRIPFAEIQKYYLVMNVLVLPTHREGFGMVSVEAQAMRIPVIVSDYTGCAETIINGETGLYIDGTPNSIVKALELIIDSEYAKELGSKGRIFVSENFEHTIVRECMLNLINSITKNGKEKI